MSELRVFISSTFRDLQEEREHLIKKIFPEIRALCRRRGMTFTDVDLRWGITEEEAEREGIIRICLDEIDRCRPYFIGILGERYGWTPPVSDAERVAADFPEVADALMSGVSITEMEIVHGVLADPAMAGHAFFYFRDRSATPEEFVDGDADAIERQNDLKERIRQSGFPVREGFTSPTELGSWLEEDLRQLIDAEYPESEAPSPLELERRTHNAFSVSRRRAYVVNPERQQRFDAWLDAAPPTGLPPRSLPLVISGASGLGKSSLIAHLVNEYRSDNPTAFVIEHYVGASQTSGSATSVMRHVIEEIRERFAITEELPSKPDELEKSFPNWLFRGEHYAKQSGIEMLIVIDAVNQLDAAGRRMSWLPKIIPPGIRLLVSTTPGESAEHLDERGWAELEVLPIEDEETREEIIHRYLGEFRKSITAEQTRRLTTDAKASSPLYLRVVAEELRLHGEHETLNAVIDRYVNAVDLQDVFDRVLARFENDYGEATVERLMSVVWASRSGLSELELLELAGLSRVDLSRLLLAIDYHFLRRDGLLGFFHDYLRRAVEKRYLSDDQKQQSAHLQIAEYFQSGVSASIGVGGPVPQRTASELAYQLHAVGSIDRLRESLSSIPVFLALYDGETEYEVLGYWAEMNAGTDVAASYRRGLAEWAMEDPSERSRGVGQVADLLDRLGQWAEAIVLERERLATAIECGEKSEEAAAHRSIGSWLRLCGTYSDALEELSQALELFTELGDRRGMAGTLHNIGIVYGNQGRFHEALHKYEQALEINTSIGNRQWIAYNRGSMGSVFYNRGEYDRALECFEHQLSIVEELGDRIVMAIAIGNMGNVYSHRGDEDRALECYEHQLSIAEVLGDRVVMAHAIGSVGEIYIYRGEYDRAMECLERRLRIEEELGHRRGTVLALCNMGYVYDSRGEYDRALECYERASSICEEAGDRHLAAMVTCSVGSAYSGRREYDRALEHYKRSAEENRTISSLHWLIYGLHGTAEVLVDLVRAGEVMPEYLPMYVPGATEETWHAMSVQHARECVEECITISDELSKPDTQFSGRVLLARIEAAEGNVDGAVERLDAMLAEATDDAQRAELHYWLWKLGSVGHATAALTLYETQYATVPKYEYHKRIEELRAAGEQA